MSVQQVRAIKWEVRRCISSLENSVYHWELPNKFQITHIFYSLFWLEKAIERFNIMARGSKREKQEFVFKGFVNVRFTEEMKEGFDAWDVHDSDVFDGIAHLISSGYKLSLSETADRKGCSCSVTATQHHKKNHGMCVTSYAPDAYNAFRLALYKVTVIMPDDWRELEKENDKPVWG